MAGGVPRAAQQGALGHALGLRRQALQGRPRGAGGRVGAGAAAHPQAGGVGARAARRVCAWRRRRTQGDAPMRVTVIALSIIVAFATPWAAFADYPEKPITLLTGYGV